MATVKSFSLPDEAVLVLEQIPKNERSEFVSVAILEAAKQRARLLALQAIKSFPRFEVGKGDSIVDTVREIRREAK